MTEPDYSLCAMKTCPSCGEIKPRDTGFQRHSKKRWRSDGGCSRGSYYSRVCKDCQKAKRASVSPRRSYLPGEGLSGPERHFFCVLVPTGWDDGTAT